MRIALEEAGLDKKSYAGHSFRIETATTTSLCGISEAIIKMLGRWESAAYQLHIHTPRESLARVSALISSSSKNELTKMSYLQMFRVHVVEFLIGVSLWLYFNLCCTWWLGVI